MTKRKMTVTATSPVAMGKALVLLATSCAALSNGVATRSTALRGGHRASAPSQGRLHNRDKHGEFYSSMVALRYRNGDEDQTVDMMMANDRAVDEAADRALMGKAQATGPTPTATGGGAMTTTMPKFTLTVPRIRFTMPSMPSMPARQPHSPPSKEEKEQMVMDEYLEYVDKRYSRMHPRHRAQHSKQRQHAVINFQAVAWTVSRKILLSTLSLHRQPSLTVAPTTPASATPPTREAPAVQQDTEEEEDPLIVLGLSSLASARLRQRLHVPRDLRDEATFLSYCMSIRSAAALSPPATAPAVTPATSTAPSASAVAVKTVAGGRASAHTALSFPAQLRVLAATLRRLTRLLATCAERLAAEIATKGGCRKSARVLGAASMAFLFLFRPLFKGAWQSTSA